MNDLDCPEATEKYDFNSHSNSIYANTTSVCATKRISNEANLDYQKSKLFLTDACVINFSKSSFFCAMYLDYFSQDH